MTITDPFALCQRLNAARSGVAPARSHQSQSPRDVPLRTALPATHPQGHAQTGVACGSASPLVAACGDEAARVHHAVLRDPVSPVTLARVTFPRAVSFTHRNVNLLHRFRHDSIMHRVNTRVNTLGEIAVPELFGATA